MHHQTILPVITLLSFSLVAGCASEPPRRGPGDRPSGGERLSGYIAQPIGLLLAGFDDNTDHSVSLKELKSGAETEWQILSHGQARAGAVDYSRWASSALGTDTALPARVSFDADLDGVITREEFISGMIAEFRKLDFNQDQQLTRKELLKKLPDQGFGDRGSGSGSGGRQKPQRGERPQQDRSW